MLAPYDWYRNTASPDYTLHVAWDDLAFAMRTNKLSEAPLHDLALDVRSNGLSEVAMLTLGDRPKGLVDEHFDEGSGPSTLKPRERRSSTGPGATEDLSQTTDACLDKSKPSDFISVATADALPPATAGVLTAFAVKGAAQDRTRR